MFTLPLPLLRLFVLSPSVCVGLPAIRLQKHSAVGLYARTSLCAAAGAAWATLKKKGRRKGGAAAECLLATGPYLWNVVFR